MARNKTPRPVSGAEDKAITKAAMADPDAQPLSEKERKSMRRVDLSEIQRKVRGPGKRPAKVAASIRFDADVLEGLREIEGYSALVNDAMRGLVLDKSPVKVASRGGEWVVKRVPKGAKGSTVVQESRTGKLSGKTARKPETKKRA